MIKKSIYLIGLSLILLFAAMGNLYAAPNCCGEINIYTPEQVQHNQDIAGIQRTLQILGYYRGPINGYYNSDTIKSVISFQAKEKLPATGIFDVKTRSRLVSYYEGQQPKNNIAPQGKVSLKVDLEQKLLFVYDDGKLFYFFPVAVGRNDASPIGEWTIVNKIYNPGGPYGSRYMGLSCSWAGYGIHGTNQPWSIGGEFSAGCIRMHNTDAAELFEWVKEGTPVNIVGMPYSPYYEARPQIGPGWRGSETVLVQQKLREKGYFKGEVNGNFQKETTEALKKFQKDHGFEPDGIVNADIYAALGL